MSHMIGMCFLGVLYEYFFLSDCYVFCMVFFVLAFLLRLFVGGFVVVVDHISSSSSSSRPRPSSSPPSPPPSSPPPYSSPPPSSPPPYSSPPPSSPPPSSRFGVLRRRKLDFTLLLHRAFKYFLFNSFPVGQFAFSVLVPPKNAPKASLGKPEASNLRQSFHIGTRKVLDLK